MRNKENGTIARYTTALRAIDVVVVTSLYAKSIRVDENISFVVVFSNKLSTQEREREREKEQYIESFD
jgi:hypothetical protein